MAIFRWVFIAAMAAGFLLLAVSNWTPVDFILPDGTPAAVPLPLLLGIAFLAGVIPTWIWHVLLRPLAESSKVRPARVERTETAPSSGA
jgi:lipopolysaccharide assembly protein A